MVTMDAKGVSWTMLSDTLKQIKDLTLKQATHMRLRYIVQLVLFEKYVVSSFVEAGAFVCVLFTVPTYVSSNALNSISGCCPFISLCCSSASRLNKGWSFLVS